MRLVGFLISLWGVPLPAATLPPLTESDLEPAESQPHWPQNHAPINFVREQASTLGSIGAMVIESLRQGVSPPTLLVIFDIDGTLVEDHSGFMIPTIFQWKPLPGALELIHKLHRVGVQLLAVSDAPASSSVKKLGDLGLLDIFELESVGSVGTLSLSAERFLRLKTRNGLHKQTFAYFRHGRLAGARSLDQSPGRSRAKIIAAHGAMMEVGTMLTIEEIFFVGSQQRGLQRAAEDYCAYRVFSGTLQSLRCLHLVGQNRSSPKDPLDLLLQNDGEFIDQWTR